MSLDELIQLSERMNIINIDLDNHMKETTFSESTTSMPVVSLSRPFSDPKLEKKVTFARLLSKVSHEMGSGSEVELRNVSNCIWLVLYLYFVFVNQIQYQLEKI